MLCSHHIELEMFEVLMKRDESRLKNEGESRQYSLVPM